MTFVEMELELNLVYDKIKTALFLELQNPDWILLRDDRRVIVERRREDGGEMGGATPFLLFGDSTGKTALFTEGKHLLPAFYRSFEGGTSFLS